jgi:hypothetical protein
MNKNWQAPKSPPLKVVREEEEEEEEEEDDLL